MWYNFCMRFVGFEPVFDGNSKTLILGSFPSVISRRDGFYYGNKQNRFWRTLATVFGADVPKDNDEKREFVLSRGIALWDIVCECEIVGSMDKDIREFVVADLDVILSKARIEKILLNGGTAYKIFASAYGELLPIARKMPSTSSANPRFDLAVWQKELL